MADVFDYGNFSRAAARLLKPAAQQFHYGQIKGSTFGREKADWIEGFELQQSRHGSGDFCVNIGIYIPKLHDLWSEDHAFGLLIWDRLEFGADAATWHPAGNRLELQAGIEQVGKGLAAKETWFAEFKTLSDVADAYEARNNLNEVKEHEHLSSISMVNYGFLLLLADRKKEAMHWLERAHVYWQRVVSESEADFLRRRPGKEAFSYHELDIRRLNAITTALNKKTSLD